MSYTPKFHIIAYTNGITSLQDKISNSNPHKIRHREKNQKHINRKNPQHIIVPGILLISYYRFIC